MLNRRLVGRLKEEPFQSTLEFLDPESLRGEGLIKVRDLSEAQGGGPARLPPPSTAWAALPAATQALLGMPAPSAGEDATLTERTKALLQVDLLAADLKCSFFASALQSYKRDSALRPFPSFYTTEEAKDFEALLADTNALVSLKELLTSPQNTSQRTWELLGWILSSKALTIHSANKNEYKKIQELTGVPSVAVPAPDFLFEITYCSQMDAKFEETRAGRDLIYAFHGSRLENFHSIVHNGLHCHLNKNVLGEKNRKEFLGRTSYFEKTSLFGEGTYLTSDLGLALLYSPHGLGWQHSAMGPVLSCVALCEIIDHPDVKCQVQKKDSKEIDKKRARVKNSEGGDVPQKYFVVTNNQLIRVKYLLVYSQKQHRRPASQSWVSKHCFGITMTFYLLLLVAIGACNSPTFAYYWNKIFDVEQ